MWDVKNPHKTHNLAIKVNLLDGILKGPTYGPHRFQGKLNVNSSLQFVQNTSTSTLPKHTLNTSSIIMHSILNYAFYALYVYLIIIKYTR